MSHLSQQRCFNHAPREAAARCPSCRRFYCRECVAEHDHRLLCAQCIQQIIEHPEARKRMWFGPLGATLRLMVALAVLWMIFLASGQFLLLLPASFHDASAAATVMEEVP